MKISKKTYEEIYKELKLMFSDRNYKGEISLIKNYYIEKGIKKVLITIKTKNMILITNKENLYLNKAFRFCDNYSLDAEGDNLIITFGFVIVI